MSFAAVENERREPTGRKKKDEEIQTENMLKIEHL